MFLYDIFVTIFIAVVVIVGCQSTMGVPKCLE